MEQNTQGEAEGNETSSTLLVVLNSSDMKFHVMHKQKLYHTLASWLKFYCSSAALSFSEDQWKAEESEEKGRLKTEGTQTNFRPGGPTSGDES